MHVRRSPSGDGPTIYRPNESVSSVRLDPPARSSVAHDPESIPTPPRDSLLSRVNRRRGQILTAMVSIAAVASFGSVVWWAHNQDVKAGGRGLEPLVVQAPTTPSRVKPENAGGLTVPNQDKEVFNRLQPNAVPPQPEKLLPTPTNPRLPAGGMPLPAAPKPADNEVAAKSPTPLQAAPAVATVPPGGAAAAPPANAPPVADAPKSKPTENAPSIASLIDGMSGPTGGWRVQVASVKNEDVAKSTWARLQSAHGDVMANLRMQAVRVDLGERGVWYRVQGGPLDEKQAQGVCSALRSRKADCVLIPPAR